MRTARLVGGSRASDAPLHHVNDQARSARHAKGSVHSHQTWTQRRRLGVKCRQAWPLVAVSASGGAMNTSSHRIPSGVGDTTLHLGVQAPRHECLGDVLYVHGATFASDLSVFFRFGGPSWADALNDAGFRVWGLDFLGYGRSDRCEGTSGGADAAAVQLTRAIKHVRESNGGAPVHLIAHSWGTIPALVLASSLSDSIGRIVLFGPIVERSLDEPPPAVTPLRTVNIWQQYRRFTEDVPKGHPPLIDDADMARWARAYLESDPTSQDRHPPSVLVPSGPVLDIHAQWNGKPLYDLAKVNAPVLLVRGEWDSLCTDQDAARFMSRVGSQIRADICIARGTHLMHLESSRVRLHEETNRFLRAPVSSLGAVAADDFGVPGAPQPSPVTPSSATPGFTLTVGRR
jgi:pimeloyl-ACP methyl ester carboxylesterase